MIVEVWVWTSSTFHNQSDVPFLFINQLANHALSNSLVKNVDCHAFFPRIKSSCELWLQLVITYKSIIASLFFFFLFLFHLDSLYRRSSYVIMSFEEMFFECMMCEDELFGLNSFSFVNQIQIRALWLVRLHLRHNNSLLFLTGLRNFDHCMIRIMRSFEARI